MFTSILVGFLIRIVTLKDHLAKDPKVPLTIGFLSSYTSSRMTLGAIPLAVEEVNNDPNLLPGRKLQFVVADIGNPSMRLLFILMPDVN